MVTSKRIVRSSEERRGVRVSRCVRGILILVSIEVTTYLLRGFYYGGI